MDQNTLIVKQIPFEEDLITPVDLDSVNKVLESLTKVQKFLNGLEEEAVTLASSDAFDDSHLFGLKEILAEISLKYINAAGSEAVLNDSAIANIDAEIENLLNEISCVRKDSLETAQEIENLAAIVATDSKSLEGDLADLERYRELLKNGGNGDLNIIQKKEAEELKGENNVLSEYTSVSKVMRKDQYSPLQLETELEQLKMELSKSEDLHWHEICMSSTENFKFQALNLEDQIKKKTEEWTELKKLDTMFKRVEAVSMIEESLSDIRDISFSDDCIKMHLKSYVPVKGGSICQYSIESIKEPLTVEHTLTIKVAKESMLFLDVELSPDNVPIDDIVSAVKRARESQTSTILVRGQLEHLVREIRFRIFCYTIRNHVLDYDARFSQNAFHYSQRDQVVTVNVFGGIKAFIKVPQNWPVTLSPLRLISLKPADDSKSDVSLSILCQSMEIINNLELPRRQNVVSFIDAVDETLVQEMKRSSKFQT